MVDNTFATPVNQMPLDEGSGLVVYSAIRDLNGHSDAMVGILSGPMELGFFITGRSLVQPCTSPPST
ncbi:PLP-dependent transferase [uncultured Porticoccus sp.]|uniref:PLP-dependent transferase n=1 Tax=uncultured Porticoccus sp. TaxID=1256050 RepID=UPI0034175A1B